MAKVLVNIKPIRPRWYLKEPEGTMEEKEMCYEIAQSYLYKMLDFADKGEPIGPVELAFNRRLFSYLKQGPWAGHFTAAQRCKITSADALYCLTSSLPSTIIGEKLGIHPRKVKSIRSGKELSFYNEYLLIRRLTTLIKARLKNNGLETIRKTYKLSELIAEDRYEDLYYTSSMRKAIDLRKKIIKKVDYDILISNNTLDIMYPIKEISIL